LYDGRLEEGKKWGADIFTTRSYKEILNRKDVGCRNHWNTGSPATADIC
jgi:hypothetical protein